MRALFFPCGSAVCQAKSSSVFWLHMLRLGKHMHNPNPLISSFLSSIILLSSFGMDDVQDGNIQLSGLCS